MRLVGRAVGSRRGGDPSPSSYTATVSFKHLQALARSDRPGLCKQLQDQIAQVSAGVVEPGISAASRRMARRIEEKYCWFVKMWHEMEVLFSKMKE